MCDKLNVKDIVEHLKMLKDGLALAEKLSKECTGVIKSDLFYAMRDVARDGYKISNSKASKVEDIIDYIEHAPKMFDAIEYFWQEQQSRRHHKKMFVSEPLFQDMCGYIIGFREARKAYG